MSKEKAIEICKNLEQSINRAMPSVLSPKHPMFISSTTDKQRLKTLKNELIKKYKLTKKDLK